MSLNNNLYSLIKDSFGRKGKTIKIVNTRRSTSGTRISDINYTKDGKTILASFCDQFAEDSSAFAIYEEVNKFEALYGDGTSLLTMLLTSLTRLNNVSNFSEEEIDRDIDYIISLIEETSLDNLIKDEYTELSAFKNWLMTVCKSDEIYLPLYNFLSNNRKINIKSIKQTENNNFPEIFFKARAGYNISTRIHNKFLTPSLSYTRDLPIILLKEKLVSELYKSFDSHSFQLGKKLIVVCTDVTSDVETLINESETDNIIVVRVADDEIDDVFDDMTFLLKQEQVDFPISDKISYKVIISKIKEMKLTQDYALLFGFDRTKDELIDYCDDLFNNFTSTDENEKELLRIRIANISADNTFDILLNPITQRRFKMLFGMIEDVSKAMRHFDKGLIVGGMSYIDNADPIRSSAIIKQVKDIKKLLHNNESFSLSKKECIKSLINKNGTVKECVPIDLKANTIAIFEIARSFLKELANTSDANIDVKFKWIGA